MTPSPTRAILPPPANRLQRVRRSRSTAARSPRGSSRRSSATAVATGADLSVADASALRLAFLASFPRRGIHQAMQRRNRHRGRVIVAGGGGRRHLTSPLRMIGCQAAFGYRAPDRRGPFGMINGRDRRRRTRDRASGESSCCSPLDLFSLTFIPRRSAMIAGRPAGRSSLRNSRSSALTGIVTPSRFIGRLRRQYIGMISVLHVQMTIISSACRAPPPVLPRTRRSVGSMSGGAPMSVFHDAHLRHQRPTAGGHRPRRMRVATAPKAATATTSRAKI